MQLMTLSYLQRRCIKEQNAKKKENAGLSAVKKVLFILCYVVSFCSISFASNSLNLTFNTRFFALVTQYFACEANGYDSNKTCASEKMAYEALTYPEVIMTYYLLLAVFPAMTLIFIVPLKKLKLIFIKLHLISELSSTMFNCKKRFVLLPCIT